MQFNNDITRKVAEEAARILEGSTPKTEKEKELAAMGHPKDKITHKDVLIGRGVLRKEEKEESCEDEAEEAVDKHEKKMHGKKGEVAKHEKAMHKEDVKEPTGSLKDACWKGYTAVGMKMKNGRKVPNCVPVKEEEEIDEELKGNQHKIDANKNGKVDAHDFKLLRAKKKVNEATKSEEGKFHNKLDKLVHKTFGKSSDEKKMKEEVELDEALWPGTPEYEKKFPKASKPGQRRKTQDYGYQGKEEEHGETSYKKDDEKPKRGKYGARQNYVRSRRVSGRELKDDVQVGFTDILEAYDSHGLKFIAAMMKEEPDNEEFTKEVEDQKKSMEGKKKQPEVAKASVQAVKQEEVEQIDELSKDSYKKYLSASKKEVHKHMSGSQLSRYGDYAGPQQDRELNTKNAQKFANKKLKNEEVELEERTLTEPEKAKKEEIVKSMKKNMKGFKERYGERGKSVAYATATKIAKEKA
jgi:uncharacterized protein with PIN domain